MRSAQRARSIFVLLVAIGAVLCALALTHSAAPPGAAAETRPAPFPSVPAAACTSSISIVSFAINKSEVAAGESLSASLTAANSSTFTTYTHYYEVVILNDSLAEVTGTKVGTDITIGDKTLFGDPTEVDSSFPLTVPEGTENGAYFVRVNVRTQDGGQICLIDTVGLTVNTPAPEPDPASCDNGNVQIASLSFPSGTRQGNGIMGHIRVRNASEQAWPVEVRLEIQDPDLSTEFRDTWTATLSRTNRELNRYPSWATATSNQLGTYTVHASVRSGGEVCHATFASGTRTYTLLSVETFELTDGNSPPTPALVSPASGSSDDDATPTLEWEDVDDAEGSRVSYALQVSTDSRFRRDIVVSLTGRVSNDYPIRRALSPGRYYWRVKSSDSAGNSNNRWSVGNFRVTAPPVVTNSPPTITAFSPPSTSLTVEEGNTGWEFSATGTDTDNNLSGYAWFLDDQPTTTTGNLSSASGSTEFVRRFSRDFADFEPGTYRVRVTFTDDAGESVSRTWTVTVPGQAPPSEPSMSPTVTAFAPIPSRMGKLRVGRTQLFEAVVTDPDGILSRLEWRVEGITESERPLGSTGVYRSDFTREFPRAGTYRVEVVLFDEERELGSASWIARVGICGGASQGDYFAEPAWFVETSSDSSTGRICVYVRIDEQASDSNLRQLRFILYDHSRISPGIAGSGSVTIAFPRKAWIDYKNIERRIATNFESWRTYTEEAERDAVATEKFINSLLKAIPVVGLVYSGAEILSLGFSEEEQQGPSDEWLSENWNNCTSRITVPWQLGEQGFGFDNVRGIEVIVPVLLKDDDYVSLYSVFSPTNLADYAYFPPDDVDVVFVGDHGAIEIKDVLRTGQEKSPNCLPPWLDAAGEPSTPRIIVSPAVLTVKEGDDDGATYTAQLSAEPDGRISVEIGLGSNTELSVTRSSISFDADDWDDPQPVTVRALHDGDADSDAPVELVHTAYDSDRNELDRENVVVIIEEDDVPGVQPSGPRWLSSSTKVTVRTGSGGGLEVRVLTLDTTSNPSITIDGPGLSDTRRTGSCSLQHRPPGFVAGVTRCWAAVFTLPVNDTGSTRSYTVTADSTDIAEDLVTDVAVSPTPEPDPAPVPQPGATTTVAVATGLAPLGDNLQWVLRFDNATQQWQSHSPAAPSAGTLTELVPGRIYWIGVNADQTAVLGGVSRTLMAGLNQVVW